jgi:adenosylmethionine-8-amino-7-oxononanoate aminotransferase
VVFSDARGIRLTDIQGKSYIDALSGLWVVNVGHGRKELAQVAAEQMSRVAYVNTFAYTTPAAIEEEGLVDNSARTGAYLLEQLKQVQARHHTVGDVRGLGLMVQIDLVKDRVTKDPFGQADDMNNKIGERLKQRGLLCRAGTSINIAPPLITHREDVDEIVDIIDAVIGDFESELT